MRCTECGARYQTHTRRCPECGALQTEISTGITVQAKPAEATRIVEPSAPVVNTKKLAPTTSPSLIEFPGVNRSSVPEWRREIGERVRERQEKRARESVLETATGVVLSEFDSQSAPALELLPQAEVTPVNPLVAAALRRIERANTQPAISAALATAIAYEEPTLEIDQTPTLTMNPEVGRPERVHNLAVVPALEPPPSIETQIIEVPAPVVPVVRTKPKKVIDELNCPSLNYLDSITTAVTLETRNFAVAGFFRRIFSGVVDILVIALLSTPFLGLVNLTKFTWQEPRVVAFLASVFLLVGFLYLTISVAFTGRTLGMKLWALRVVDARTGLIPTGSQSAGRSIVFMLSLATAGLVMMYALINRDRQTIHDQFTRTAVIRA